MFNACDSVYFSAGGVGVGGGWVANLLLLQRTVSDSIANCPCWSGGEAQHCVGLLGGGGDGGGRGGGVEMGGGMGEGGDVPGGLLE